MKNRPLQGAGPEKGRAMNYLLVQANAAAVLASEALRLHAIIAQDKFNEEVWEAVCSLVRSINDNHTTIGNSVFDMSLEAAAEEQAAEDEQTYQEAIRLR